MRIIDRSGLSRQMPASVEKSASAAALPVQGYLPMLGGTPSASGMIISQSTAMTVAAVYACVLIRAQDVARCPPRLSRRDATGRKVPVTDHPVAKLLRRPNQWQTYFRFTEQTVAGYLLRGNGYAVRRYDRRTGALKDLIPVNPDAVLVAESGGGEIFYNTNRIGLWQTEVLKDFPYAIAKEDMFHLPGLAFNALVGASTIGLARDAIGVSMGLEQQSARWMANGSRPSVILQSKKALNKEAGDRLKQAWRDMSQGIQNVGTTMVLEDGIEAKELKLTSVDMEFMAQRKFSVEDICRFYRMPPFKLGLTELRGVDIDQVTQDYVNNTVMPDLHRLEQEHDAFFNLSEQGLEIRLDETVLLRADITTRYTAARIALGGGAFASVNEVRRGEDWPDADPEATGADAITRPVNMATIGSNITGTAPDGAGRPAANTGGVPKPDATGEAVAIAPETPRGSDDGKGLGATFRAKVTLEKAGLPL
ncbi:MAG: phage portal protein [Ancalomicrobiaceae bacterium]|nr:phage portal protein [Ancalomicrobiaceae bacterium]